MIELNGAGQNGNEKALPVLGIAWDEEKQLVQLVFDPSEFKTWNFVLGILEMGRQHAEHNLRIQQMENLKQAAAQQHQSQLIAQQVKRNLRG